MEYANVHPLIGNLCVRPEGGVDVAMFQALHTELSLEEAMDLVEMDEVSRSWHTAVRANADHRSERGRRRGQ